LRCETIFPSRKVRNIATNAFISLPAGKFITGTARIPPHSNSTAQISEAADSALRRDPVWKFLEDHIGSEEIGDGFGRAHGSHRLQILMDARNVA
jgi:hypothetical protein